MSKKDMFFTAMAMIVFICIGFTAGIIANNDMTSKHMIYVKFAIGDKVQVIQSYSNDPDFNRIGNVEGFYWFKEKGAIYYLVTFDSEQSGWHGYKAEELWLIK